MTDQVERGLVTIEYCPTDQMVADYATKALQGKSFGNHRCFIMNLPQTKVAEKAVCHMMRARFPVDGSSEEESAAEADAVPQDTGPTVPDAERWSDDPNLQSDEAILASGGELRVSAQAPYQYQDALQDKIVHEVLTPDALRLWFKNRESPGFLDAREAYHRGKPIRNILYGNCHQCLRAGGLLQRCHTCGIDEAFQAMIIYAMYDVPEVMVDARFLHRMVGYQDKIASWCCPSYR